MTRNVSDVLTMMRLILSRRNANDPDSTNDVFLKYLNDFVSLTMSDEVRLFEQFGTLTFDIDETNTTGVYTFNDLGISQKFVSITGDAFISWTDATSGYTSWNHLCVYQNPGQFFSYWGVDNEDILTLGMPTEVLFYGNEFTFRTIPDQEYTVTMYGYKKNDDFSTEGNPELDFDYHLRFYAYGAALNYAMDYRYSDTAIDSLKRDYAREKNRMLKHAHNQIVTTRGFPSF